MDLANVCRKVQELAIQVGDFIREEKNKISSEMIEVKGLNNFVTYVDKTSEQRLTEGLVNIIPESGFIVEENTINKQGMKYTWIIDPLDGTTNFIHGLPPFAISIALMVENEIVLGVVYEISLNECFYAWANGKAYLNKKEIRVSNAESVDDSLIGTGFPYYEFKRLSPFLSSLEFFMKNSHGVRRLGSAATDLAYVACGRFDAFYEYNLNSWDVAAGALIVKQAGGKVSDFIGGDNYIFGKEIIATNHFIFKEFLGNVKIFMAK